MPDPNDYTIGWICALNTELTAARVFLDELHDQLDNVPGSDNNSYVLGRIGKHNVVIAVMPHWQYGTTNAAVVARDMAHTFPSLRIGLMVGIGGGAPSAGNDIRLGDVVVSSPGYASGGVLQYDYGKTIQGQSFKITGYLNQPPFLLLTAINLLKPDYEIDGNCINNAVEEVFKKKPLLKLRYSRPESSTDRLYESDCVHQGTDEIPCEKSCGEDRLKLRDERLDGDDLKIHYGLIASGNMLMKDAVIRDALVAEKGVLCFEMEAAGLMNHFPCLVIRGICDYADSHKTVSWQGYAAMAAAAYAKDLLYKIVPSKVNGEQSMHEILFKVHETINQVQRRIDDISVDARFEKLNKWLSPPDPSIDFNNALHYRQPGSGQWLFQTVTFSNWKSRKNSVLWLYGIPGCGKTILASTIVEHLKRDSTCLRGLLYFYFRFNDTSKQNLDDALRSLVSQLYVKRDDVRNHLDGLFDSCQEDGNQPDIKKLATTFKDMARHVGEIWIVLDALDECPVMNEAATRSVHQRKELLSWLQDLWDLPINIHLLITSRPAQDIEETIESWPHSVETISISNELVEADIHAYIRTRVQEDQGLKRWRSNPKVQKDIEEKLMGNSGGMFRWVSCQLDALENCHDQSSVRRTLASLPRTLDDTYARILSNIPPNYLPYATRILQFLTYSERPLRMEEAIDAIAVQPANIPRFDPKDRIVVPHEIQRYCSSLVLITKVKGKRGKNGMVVELQLAHQSVKEYLTSNRLTGEFAESLGALVSSTSIAEVCLSYLVQLEEGVLKEEVEQLFPMIEYAADCWAKHAAMSECNSENVRALTMELLSNRSLYEMCYQLSGFADSWGYRELPSPLSFASRVGLKQSVKGLIDHETNDDDEYGNALRAASYGGHEEIARMLLEEGANVNAPDDSAIYDWEEEFPLYAASYEGHERVVQLLLDWGADVNARCGEYDTALQAASYRGHTSIVQRLLNNNADADAHGGYWNNPLFGAFVAESEEIVQMLLVGGADANSQGGATIMRGGLFEYALQAASYRGWVDTVQMLLDKGADLNARDATYGNAFDAALQGGRREIFKMLLHTGGEREGSRRCYISALRAAAEEGDKELVQMVLDQGIHPSARDEREDEYFFEYGDALYVASRKGYIEIVQMLLDRGADPTAESGIRGNALRAAEAAGNVNIFRMLQEKRDTVVASADPRDCNNGEEGESRERKGKERRRHREKEESRERRRKEKR
ncbi:hypothetical protein F5X98DRAFT_358030 [Xylaria grammica]|nr:hypothetical protein F5X98DRAFT_358030 [Xylaria grammica]